jgi:hypothetical protein
MGATPPVTDSAQVERFGDGVAVEISVGACEVWPRTQRMSGRGRYCT